MKIGFGRNVLNAVGSIVLFGKDAN